MPRRDHDHRDFDPEDFEEPRRRGEDDLPLRAIPSAPETRRHSDRGFSPFVVAVLLVVGVVAVTWWFLSGRETGQARLATEDVAPAEPSPTLEPSPEPAASATPQAVDTPAAAAPTPALVPDANTAPSVQKLLQTVEQQREQLGEQQRQSEELARLLEQQRERTKQGESQLASLQRQIDQVQREAEQRQRRLASENKQLGERSQQLERQLESERSRTSQLTQQQQQLETRLAELEQTLESERARATRAEQQAADADERARTRVREAQEILRGESEATRELLSRLEATRDERDREARARSEAEQRVEALERRVRGLESELENERRVQPGDLVAMGANVLAPQRVKTVEPRYPQDARMRGISGRVSLRVLVSETGDVLRVEVQSSPDDSLAEAAREAALRFRYNPGLKKGTPVKVWVAEYIDFR